MLTATDAGREDRPCPRRLAFDKVGWPLVHETVMFTSTGVVAAG
jgi:hypothetical protein